MTRLNSQRYSWNYNMIKYVEDIVVFLASHFLIQISLICSSAVEIEEKLEFKIICFQRNWVFATNYDFLIPISLQTDVALLYAKAISALYNQGSVICLLSILNQ